MAASRSHPISKPRATPESLQGLGRAWPSLVAAATALILFVALAWKAGGYFPGTYLAAGVAAYGVLAVLLAVRPPYYPISIHALIALAALAGFAAWTGLSTRWSPAPDIALRDMQRDVVYVGVFGLALLAAGSGRFAHQVVWGALIAITVVVVGGLVSRFYPDVLADHAPRLSANEYRLGYPLGYWNAYGGLAAMGTVLALGLTGDPRSRVPARAVAAGLTVLLACGLYLSFSRGAWFATFAGLAVLVAFASKPGALLLGAVVAGGGAALALTRLSGLPALTDDPTAAAGQLSAGHTFGPQLLLLAVAAAAAQWVVAAGHTNENLMQALRRVVRPLLIGIATCAVAGAGLLYVARTTKVNRHTAGILVRANGWVDKQWNEFMAPTAFSAEGTQRLTTAKGTRSDYYGIALAAFRDHPVRGAGAGGFEVRAATDRRNNEVVRNAHSLYHETLADLGLVGFGLLAMFIGAVVFGALKARVRPAALARPQAAAVSAAVAVWLVHNAVDWDWQMASVTTVGLLLTGLLFPEGRRHRRRSSGPVKDG